MKKIRAFLAIQLPEKARGILSQVSQELAPQMPARAVRWVAADRIHLTLRFLGETPVSKVPVIGAQMDEIAAVTAPFELVLDDLGCFPNRKRPRIIWVGIQGEVDALRSLKTAVDEALMPLGWEKESRPFRAHLTLGRVKDSRRLQGVEWRAEVKKEAICVTAFHLIESRLMPSGPIYTIRHTSRLQNT